MADIKFDRHNYRKHSDRNKELIRKSLDECGAGRSILIDSENEIIAGNGVYEQAKEQGIPVKVIETDGSELVVVKRTDLKTDDERRKKLALADNATADHVEWDAEALGEDWGSDKLGEWEVSLPTEGFEVAEGESEDEEIERKKREFKERMEAGELDEDDPEYQEFVAKFEVKRTTDDCYTPEIVYDAIAKYVADHYHESRSSFVRPFYPGGNYEKEQYPKGCVVVDNPPFSILAQIVRFYTEKKIKYFLFAPYLTMLHNKNATAIVTNSSITYENGANVNTSFLTNLEPYDVKAKSDPVLAKIIKDADEESLRQNRKELPKYSFPDNVLTAAMLGKFARYGIPFEVKRDECVTIPALDEMKEHKKGIYGSGLLMSDRKAAEKAAAEKAAAEKAEKAVAMRWTLSERERDIVNTLK